MPKRSVEIADLCSVEFGCILHPVNSYRQSAVATIATGPAPASASRACRSGELRAAGPIFTGVSGRTRTALAAYGRNKANVFQLRETSYKSHTDAHAATKAAATTKATARARI